MARYVRVASISFSGAGVGETASEKVENNVNGIIRLLRIALLESPDIVCLPECAPMLGLTMEESVSAAEEVPNAIFERVAQLAKGHKAYIICPMMVRRGGRVYNSALLIGRDGSLVGSYEKVHPTIWELEAGVTPGFEARPFNLDFGRVGFAICFDLNFDDVMRALCHKGVKLVFFPSMYRGGLQLKIWAFNCGAYVISSFTGEGSEIVSPLGKTLVSSSRYQPIICRDLNLDYEILHLDYNNEKLELMKERYGYDARVEVAEPEGVFMLSYEGKFFNVGDLVEEFGLETRDHYFERALSARERTLR